MAPRLNYNQFDLGYPPWALDFDPYNRGFLLVSGGGGEGQKEVPNRLTLLNISSRYKIDKAAELDTGMTDDCPMSVATLATKEGLVAYSGINSGAQDRKKGINKHFRSYRVDYPQRKSEKNAVQEKGTIQPLSQSSLFSPSYSMSGDAFQRLLRLSPATKRPTGGKRIGGIANSLAKESEIVVFDATTATPNDGSIIERVKPPRNTEANDLDIAETAEGEFQLAYCTTSEVYVQSISYDAASRKKKLIPEQPSCAHTAAPQPASARGSKPRFRSIRFLTPQHLLLLQNKGGSSELSVLRIYSDGSEGDIILRKLLPKRMGAAVSLDVCSLDTDVATGAKQVIVAVAAQTEDLLVLTIDYAGSTRNTFGGFFQYKDLRGVHPMPMKKVVLSPFHSPWLAKGSESDKQNAAPGPQYIKMASISMSNTLVIDYLPLHPLSSSKRGSRYILQKSSRTMNAVQNGSSIFVLFFCLGVGLLLLQSFLSAQAGGQNPSVRVVPEGVFAKIEPYIKPVSNIWDQYLNRIEEAASPYVHSETIHRIEDALHIRTLRHKLADVHDGTKAIFIRAEEDSAGLSSEVHKEEADVMKQDDNAKKWEDLSKVQQQRWKKRLIDAGAWAADEGEVVLKGVFFSELAKAVGGAIMG